LLLYNRNGGYVAVRRDPVWDAVHLAAGDFLLKILAAPGIVQTNLALHSLAQYLPFGAARNCLSGEA
ncbi:MAG: hypothetical protein PHS30_09165, partial [Bacteroidales bacterium]|nr:hypothetical protein [Bacteroidales bacterium]